MEALNELAAPIEVPHRCLIVRDDEDVGRLRRTVTSLATISPGIHAGDAGLLAGELGTNLVRHTTGGGYVLLRPVAGGIEMLAVDNGPGMRIARHPMVLGSVGPTAPTRPAPPGEGHGIGLAGVERLATTFDLYSRRPEGTVVLARLLAHPITPGWCRWGAVNVAVEGEEESGDSWAVTVGADGSLTALIVDGLGHGPDAATAARAAISAFGPLVGDVASFIPLAHQAMRGTRGGVLGICSIDPARGELRYAGVGNIAGRVLTDGASEGLVSRDGTLGTHRPVPGSLVTSHVWRPGATLVLASDGLHSTWDPLGYADLLRHDPTVVAAALVRDHGRRTDDTTVLVVRDLGRDVTRAP